MIYTNELTIFSRDGQLYTDSREVAEMIGKDHAHLMRDIDSYITTMRESKIGFSEFFVPSTYKVEGNNKIYPCYSITKKGCDMVANKLTGKKGIVFTAKYVNAFHDMEDKLTGKQSTKAMTAMEMLRLQGKAMTELDDRVSTVEDKLENQMTIDHGKQRTIQNLVSSRVFKRIEENIKIGCESNIQECRPLYFQSLYHDLKNRFGVASYPPGSRLCHV